MEFTVLSHAMILLVVISSSTPALIRRIDGYEIELMNTFLIVSCVMSAVPLLYEVFPILYGTVAVIAVSFKASFSNDLKTKDILSDDSGTSIQLIFV